MNKLYHGVRKPITVLSGLIIFGVVAVSVHVGAQFSLFVNNGGIQGRSPHRGQGLPSRTSGRTGLAAGKKRGPLSPRGPIPGVTSIPEAQPWESDTSPTVGNSKLEGNQPPKQRSGKWAWQPRSTRQAQDSREATPSAAKGAPSSPGKALPGWLSELREEGLEADASTYNALIGASTKTGDLEAAGRFAREAQKAGSTPDASSFDALVDTSLAKDGVEEAVAWVEQALQVGVELPLQRLLRVIEAASRKNNMDAIDQLLALVAEDYAVDVVAVYTTALQAAAKNKDVAAAMRWFGKGIKQGIAVPRGTYFSFIADVAEDCGYGVAEFWVRQASTVGLEPETQILGTLLTATWRSGEKETGRIVLKQALAQGANSSMISKLARVSASAGDIASVEHLADLLTESGVEFEVDDNNLANQLIGLAARTGGFEAAQNWFYRLYKEGGEIRPKLWTYTTMANAAAVDGGPAEAECWYRKTLDAGFKPDHVMFNILMSATAKQGDETKAREWLAEARKVGVEPTVIHYTTLANAAAQQGNLDVAEQWLEEAKESNIKLDCHLYSAVINAASKAGNIATAERWFNELKESGIEMSVVPFNTMMGAAMRLARPGQTEELFRELVDRGLTPTENTLGTLRWAVGKGRVQQLCREYGININSIMRRWRSE
mmetsp:Transcript_33844/g.79103  ORF Transcript_33844/g.79103 Transcript_33844/m.79103 type:complete len:660 (+) Transcript_33844:40-2019(+)